MKHSSPRSEVPVGFDGIDPVTFEVLRNRLNYAAERMSSTMRRTSFSPILADITDFSNALYDADCRLVSQAANCPVHIASMKYCAEAILAKFGKENIRPGDVILMNDPYQGGTHVNDITFMRPMFHGETLLGYAMNRGHWLDVGGGDAGGLSFGTHIAGEGLRLPPLHIYREGRLNEDLLELLLLNTRTPGYVKGDLQAHIGALKVAERELQISAERYGADTVLAAMRALQVHTSRVVRAAIRDIPDGTYHGEDYADTDFFSDRPIYCRVAIVVEGDTIKVDFTGSDPMVRGAINSPYANTMAAVLYSLQFFLAPDVAANEGMFEPISMHLPDDCWLNAKWPAPTVACTSVSASKVTGAIWQALGKAIPDRMTGNTSGDGNWFVCAVTDDAGETTLFSDILAGGWGGTPYHDGMSVTLDPLGNCMNLPAEVAELSSPILYEAYELRTDSAGPGRYRGGLGSILRVRFDGIGILGMETSRTIEGALGVGTDQRSAVQRGIREHPDGRRDVIAGFDEDSRWHRSLIARATFAKGELFSFETTGGGGWGNPFDRPISEVLDDVLDEYVSVEAAERFYGVAIDPVTLAVDEVRTSELRARGAPEPYVSPLTKPLVIAQD